MIVIDTEMPTCCEGCFARQEYYNPRFDETEYNCGISGENLGTHSRQDLGEWHCDKPEWCPLKEQEPKIGHWILDPDGMDWNLPAWRCSECGNRHNGLPTMDCDEMNIYLFAGSRFCPNCGAKMEGQVKLE